MINNTNGEKLDSVVREVLRNVEGSPASSDWAEMEKFLENKPKKYNISYSDFSPYVVVGIVGVVVTGILVFLIFNRTANQDMEDNTSAMPLRENVAAVDSTIKKDSVAAVQSFTNAAQNITIANKDSVAAEVKNEGQLTANKDIDTALAKSRKSNSLKKKKKNSGNPDSLLSTQPFISKSDSGKQETRIKDSTGVTKPKLKKKSKRKTSDTTNIKPANPSEGVNFLENIAKDTTRK